MLRGCGRGSALPRGVAMPSAAFARVRGVGESGPLTAPPSLAAMKISAAVAQTIDAVDDDAIARASPSVTATMPSLCGPSFTLRTDDLVVGTDQVDICSWRAALNGGRGRDDDALQCFYQQPGVDELVGKQPLSRLSNMARTFTVPVVVSI